MREIKFRGLSVETNKWYYGNLTTYHNYSNKLKQNVVVCYINGGFGNEGRINPESVGQYTGLKDKNEKEIYEGDIVLLLTKENNIKGSVVYHNGGFCIEFKGEYIIIVQSHIDLQYEAIGNIYENPELLEVEEC